MATHLPDDFRWWKTIWIGIRIRLSPAASGPHSFEYEWARERARKRAKSTYTSSQRPIIPYTRPCGQKKQIFPSIHMEWPYHWRSLFNVLPQTSRVWVMGFEVVLDFLFSGCCILPQGEEREIQWSTYLELDERREDNTSRPIGCSLVASEAWIVIWRLTIASISGLYPALTDLQEGSMVVPILIAESNDFWQI